MRNLSKTVRYENRNQIIHHIVCNQRYLFAPMVTILLCVLALASVCRKRVKKSFEVVMMQLFLQNTVYLATVTVHCIKGNNKALIIVLMSIHIYCDVLQCTTLSLVSLQRAAMVYFPLKANTWFTKRRTQITVAAEYVAFLVIVAIPWVAVSVSRPSVRSDFSDLIYLVIIAMGTIMVIANVLITCKITRRQHQGISKRRVRNNRKTAMLLCLMCLSYILSHLVPAVAITARNDDVFFLMYRYFVWVDAFVNALSYILLKTDLVVEMKQRFFCYKKETVRIIVASGSAMEGRSTDCTTTGQTEMELEQDCSSYS